MKKAMIALSAAALIAATPVAFAMGVSHKTPGHQMMHSKKSKGASRFAPGHEMQAMGSKKGHPGASGYAPGQTTGMSSGKTTKTTKSGKSY